MVTDAHGNKVHYRYKPENSENIPDTISNRGRDHRAACYIERISYGNYFDADQTERFAFHVVFDYGEYDLTTLETPSRNRHDAGGKTHLRSEQSVQPRSTAPARAGIRDCGCTADSQVSSI
jgi:Salmonella virulence plasmid 65kDa B protein